MSTEPPDICLKTLLENRTKAGMPIIICIPDNMDKQTSIALCKMTNSLLLQENNRMRFSPNDYVFDFSNYGTVDHALNDEYKGSADKIKAIYPELKDWPNWACVESYMSYGEAIYYCGNPYDGQARKEEFLAYLYAEQELGNHGYFTREDSTSFTHYDLDGLDRIWAIYDNEKAQSESGK